MRVFDVTGKVLSNRASSNGDQRKWRITTDAEDIFVKEQLYLKHYWKDNLVEVIASRICRQLNIDWLRYADYHLCEIHEDDSISYGCYSHNFLQKDEQLVTIYNMMLAKGVELEYGDNIQSIYLKLLNTLMMSGIEHAASYMTVMFLVDYLICNTDRHLSNITACKNSKCYTLSPLFDFGQGLFQGSYSSVLMPIQELIDSLIYKPYMKKFKDVMSFFLGQGQIQHFIPKEIDVSGLEFPDFNSAIVLGMQCKSLGITLKGVEKPT